MVNFECPRCEYNTDQKTHMINHIERKKMCKSTKLDVSLEKYREQVLDKTFSKIYGFMEENKILKDRIKKLENKQVKSTCTKNSKSDTCSPDKINIPIAEEVVEELGETINNAEVVTFIIDSILDTKINKIFNDEEKQMFSISFKGYLKHDPNLDFVVDLDSVWKWIGYENKGNAKRAILKSDCLLENIDYVIQNFASQLGEAKTAIVNSIGEEEDRRGGHNRETIMMTINTFKKFCMMAGTKQAYKMHDYYIKLEQCVHEVRVEEIKNFKLQLRNKDIQKEENLTKNFDKKPVIYLATVEKDIISFGYTNDIKRRLKEHRKVYGKKFTLEYCFETLYNRELETGIKTSADLYSLINDQLKPRIFSKEYHGENQTELIQLDSDFTLKKLYKIICKIKDSIDNIETIKNLSVINNELKNIIKNLVEI